MTPERPIVILDVESTGTDPAKDRIVTLAMAKVAYPHGDANDGELLIHDWYTCQCNPGFPMSEEVIACHGITNEMAASFPPFSTFAPNIERFLNGCDLAGFNCNNFDVPILWEELYRAGITWNMEGVRVIDAGNIFKKKEERTLSAAVQFYCKREHGKAHDAEADVRATLDVLCAQLQRYQDLAKFSVQELAAFSAMDERIDLAGKIVKGPDGDPVYTLRKVKGVKVKDDPGFAYWMLDKEFPENTKIVLRQILGIEPESEPLPPAGSIGFVPEPDRDLPF